jgi:hypothetical protein
MPYFLPRLHDPHNRRLDFELAVAFDGVVRLDLFLGCFLELDLVDFEAVEGGCEGAVEGECVGGVDFFSLCGFGEDAGFSTCQGLECPFEFFVL